MNTSEFPSLQEENHLKVLRLLESNPKMSQRDLAVALGVSLGKANYCLKALLGKGFIKMQRFSKSPNKLAYALPAHPRRYDRKSRPHGPLSGAQGGRVRKPDAGDRSAEI